MTAPPTVRFFHAYTLWAHPSRPSRRHTWSFGPLPSNVTAVYRLHLRHRHPSRRADRAPPQSTSPLCCRPTFCDRSRRRAPFQFGFVHDGLNKQPPKPQKVAPRYLDWRKKTADEEENSVGIRSAPGVEAAVREQADAFVARRQQWRSAARSKRVSCSRRGGAAWYQRRLDGRRTRRYEVGSERWT